MVKHITGLITAILISIPQVYAFELQHEYASGKENAGFGIGAVIGGLLGGPPGIVIGAAGGTWLGAHDSRKDNAIISLKERLESSEIELVRLQSELADMQSQDNSDVRKVRLEHNRSILEQLSHGFLLPVYFRTDSAEMDPEIQARIRKLADLICQFPEIQVQLEGHADRRGSDGYNRQLSQERTRSVLRTMVSAGFPEQRIHAHAYGETRAVATETDFEGLVFDRRVIISLSLDTEV